jgi:hypothetical protein
MVWVDDAWMAIEGIVPAKRLLLGAQRRVQLLLAGIVDHVLVPGQIVRPREDGITPLAVDGLRRSHCVKLGRGIGRGERGPDSDSDSDSKSGIAARTLCSPP